MSAKNKKIPGTRILWTGLAVVLVVMVAFYVAIRVQPQALVGAPDYVSFVDSPYFPFSSSNVRFVGAGIQGAISLTDAQTDIDMENVLLKLYRLDDKGALHNIEFEERMQPKTYSLPTVSGNNRAYTHASSLRKGEVYRVVLFEKGQNLKRRARNCTYADFQVPWIYQKPLITFSASLRESAVPVSSSESSSVYPLRLIDFNCETNPPALTRETKPVIQEATVTGNLAIQPIYNKYYLSNATSTSTVDQQLYIDPGNKLAALDGRRPAVTRAFACLRKAAEATSGPRARPQIRVTGKYQMVKGGMTDGADYFIVKSIEVPDATLAARCQTELSAVN